MTTATPTISPSTTPAPPSKRIYPLGWLRGIAALAVVLFHAYQRARSGPEHTWPLSGEAHTMMLGIDMFVDMFFVLSAFVIWLPVAQSALAGGPGQLGREVLFRRMARLMPLYLTVVLVVWAVTNPRLPGNWQDLLLHLTFTHVYSDKYIFWTDGPAWSLAVEFHYYLLIALTIPFVSIAARRLPSRRARMATVLTLPVACLTVGMVYLGWQIHVVQPAETNWTVWFNPLAKATDFGIGMALAVLCASGVRLRPAARRLAAALGVGALAALVMVRPHEDILTNWWHPAFALSIAVGLVAIVLSDDPYPAWLSWKPLSWIGGVGYGVYLVHEPVQRFLGNLGVLPEPGQGLRFLVTAAIVVVPSVLLARISGRTIEAAGLKTLGLLDSSGRSRDYYAHLPADPPKRSSRSH